VRRGGKWSWKWFGINAVGWLSFLWLTIEIGSYFKLDIFLALQKLGWQGFVGLVGLALLLSPGTYFVVKALNVVIHRKLEEVARNEQRISKNCRLIYDARKFHEYHIKIASEANEYLFATGSRSHEKDCLDIIEKRLKAIDTLSYTRILFGSIRTKPLKAHCAALAADSGLKERAKICLIGDLSRHTESFYVLNENEALVVVPSVNAIGKFDTGLVMKGPLHTKVRSIVESYARAATPWNSESS
jgi:hypothetical protein